VLNTINAIALVLLFYSLCAAQTYEIRLNRPTKIGDRYRISGTGSSFLTRTAAVEGRVVKKQSEAFTVEFEADETVLEFGSNGSLTRESLKVNNCLVRSDGIAKQLFPKGTVIVAMAEGNQFKGR
jgi:hypothetical protein